MEITLNILKKTIHLDEMFYNFEIWSKEKAVQTQLIHLHLNPSS